MSMVKSTKQSIKMHLKPLESQDLTLCNHFNWYFWLHQTLKNQSNFHPSLNLMKKFSHMNWEKNRFWMNPHTPKCQIQWKSACDDNSTFTGLSASNTTNYPNTHCSNHPEHWQAFLSVDLHTKFNSSWMVSCLNRPRGFHVTSSSLSSWWQIPFQFLYPTPIWNKIQCLQSEILAWILPKIKHFLTYLKQDISSCQTITNLWRVCMQIKPCAIPNVVLPTSWGYTCSWAFQLCHNQW